MFGASKRRLAAKVRAVGGKVHCNNGMIDGMENELCQWTALVTQVSKGVCARAFGHWTEYSIKPFHNSHPIRV